MASTADGAYSSEPVGREFVVDTLRLLVIVCSLVAFSVRDWMLVCHTCKNLQYWHWVVPRCFFSALRQWKITLHRLRSLWVFPNNFFAKARIFLSHWLHLHKLCLVFAPGGSCSVVVEYDHVRHWHFTQHTTCKMGIWRHLRLDEPKRRCEYMIKKIIFFINS